jgi:hypothetical protein
VRRSATHLIEITFSRISKSFKHDKHKYEEIDHVCSREIHFCDKLTIYEAETLEYNRVNSASKYYLLYRLRFLHLCHHLTIPLSSSKSFLEHPASDVVTPRRPSQLDDDGQLELD